MLSFIIDFALFAYLLIATANLDFLKMHSNQNILMLTRALCGGQGQY